MKDVAIGARKTGTGLLAATHDHQATLVDPRPPLRCALHSICFPAACFHSMASSVKGFFAEGFH